MSLNKLFVGAILLLTTPMIFASSVKVGLEDEVWEALKIFEGDTKTVSSDFDCQGMSIGIVQWNLGKSFGKVKEIILSVPATERQKLMPIYGESLVAVLNQGKQPTINFVRSLQKISKLDSCDAKVRKAVWNDNGKIFAKELSHLLSTQQSIKTQRSLRIDIFNDGLKNATRWAHAIRGVNAEATPKEIAYFVDMQIFNGNGLQKFGIEYRPLDAKTRDACVIDTLHYLATAKDTYLLHRNAAAKNAKILSKQKLGESESNLFCFTYKLSQQLNRPHSRQFKLTVINRRAAILYGGAYYSDKDSNPIRIIFNE